ncbi:MAG: response regulator, partial [Myxococcota bacterium]
MSIERDFSISRSMSSIRNVVGAEVLVIDRDERVQQGMVDLLSQANLNVTCVGTPDEGLAQIEKRFFSVVVLDLDTPTPSAGLTTVSEVKERSITSMVVMLTPRKSFEDAVAAIRAGAMDIVFKSPDSVEYLKGRIMEAASRSVDTREMTSILGEVKVAHEEFLKLFMESERRALDSADRLAGRDPSRAAAVDEIRLLVASSNPRLAEMLQNGADDEYTFHSALSGGQALDLCGSNTFHYVLVG